jgi:uncharacterized protein YciI
MGSNDKRAIGISVSNGPLHFDYLVRLTDAGTVLMAGCTTAVDESTFGIVVFEAADELAAHAAVMHAELFPFRVATCSVRGPQAA